MENDKINLVRVFSGESGRGYEYNVFPVDKKWPAEAGNYVFLKWQQDEFDFVPLYFGTTPNMSKNVGKQDMESLAKRAGANYIGFHSNEDLEAREAEANDLISAYQTKLNK